MAAVPSTSLTRRCGTGILVAGDLGGDAGTGAVLLLSCWEAARAVAAFACLLSVATAATNLDCTPTAGYLLLIGERPTGAAVFWPHSSTCDVTTV